MKKTSSSQVVSEEKEPGTIIENLTPMCSVIQRFTVVGKDGITPEGTLSNLTFATRTDGIEIIGNGTLQHPMDVRFPKSLLTEDIVKSMIQGIYSEFAELPHSMHTTYHLKRIIELEVEQHMLHPIQIFKK